MATGRFHCDPLTAAQRAEAKVSRQRWYLPVLAFASKFSEIWKNRGHRSREPAATTFPRESTNDHGQLCASDRFGPRSTFLAWTMLLLVFLQKTSCHTNNTPIGLSRGPLLLPKPLLLGHKLCSEPWDSHLQASRHTITDGWSIAQRAELGSEGLDRRFGHSLEFRVNNAIEAEMPDSSDEYLSRRCPQGPVIVRRLDTVLRQWPQR